MVKEIKKSSALSPKLNSKLNRTQQLFVKEYLKDLNAKQAAVRCGLPISRARQQGHRWITNAHIAQAIEKEFSQVTKKVEVSVEFVLRELMNMANCDIGEAFDEGGVLKPIHEIPTAVRKSIASFNNEELFERDGKQMTKIGTLRKVTFWDKKGSIELLGKYLAMFVDRQRVEGVDGNALPAVQVHIHKHSPLEKIEDAATRPAVAEALATTP